MFITHSSYISMPNNQNKYPRDRYIEYYEDLFNRYKLTLDKNTLKNGGLYAFHELGYAVLDKLYSSHALSQADLLIISYWCQEYDPEHAACGTHFLDRYQLNCKLLDVTDQGNLCSLIALYLIRQHYLNSNSSKAVLLAYDQSTIPRTSTSANTIPLVNAAGALILSASRTSKTQMELLDVLLFTKTQSLNHDLVNDVIEKWNIAEKKMVLYRHQNYSATNCIYFIDHILNNQNHSDISFFLILEEDIESGSIGIIVLRKTQDD